MGFENPQVVMVQELMKALLSLIAMELTHTVDYTSIHVPKVESTTMDMHETDDYIKEHIGRPICGLVPVQY